MDRRACWRGMWLAAVAVAPAAALGQVGDTSNVTYPGWIPSDRVVPEITVGVSYDPVSALWRYDYTVTNGVTAEQPIQSVMLRFNAPTSGVTSPAGWLRLPHFSSAVGAIPGVTFAAEYSEELVQTPNGVVPGEPEAALPPGQSLSGLSITSPYPPGYARSYVQGFAPVPYLPMGFDEPTVVPDDTTNSQRGWTIGPTRYTAVATRGGRRPAVARSQTTTMLMNATIPRLARAAMLALAVALPVHAAEAQVGDISEVTYPGWIPSDRVSPVITVEASYDSTTSLWRYEYVLANAAGAEQGIVTLMMRFSAPVTQTTAPRGWWRLAHFSTAPGAIPGVTFAAEGSEDFVETANGSAPAPPPAQIPPGQALSGLSILSPYPPGYARTYVQGYAPVPFLPVGFVEPVRAPHDTTNAQRGWTLGPTRYAGVATTGNRRPAAEDGFLAFMNLTERGAVLRDPAPIALEFAVNGETVLRETLQVALNGADVTAAFLPGPSDGADLVAVFRLGTSPLQVGRNVLITRVDGLVPGQDRRTADTDRIVFEVQP